MSRRMLILTITCFILILCVRKLGRRIDCNIETVSPSSWRERIIRRSSTTADLVRRGYSDKRKSFRLGRKIILPPALFEEFRKLPDTILSASAAFEDALHVQFTLGPECHVIPSFIQQRLNSTAALTKNLSSMNEEIRDGLRRVIWEPSAKTGGKLDEWSATEILHTTQSVISQLICRLVVGRTFSRNLEFTQKVADFSYSVIIWSIILDWIPDFLRPWIAWLLPIEKTKSKISDYLCGEILRCLSSPLASTETSAILHQLVHLSRAENGNSFYSVDETIKCVTTQFLSITFGAIDPTTVAVSQVVLDLLSQPSSKYLVALQEEATTVLARHGGNWSLEAVKELKLMDSFIRESQRLHPIGITLAARKVIHKGGWTFENGDHAPAGSLISVPTYAIHHDKALYSDPEQFEGFRFVEDDKLKTTGDAFLAFGYGRHACAGRQFGLVITKLIVVNLILEYEMEELLTRPIDKSLGNYLVPDLKTTIRIRGIGKS